MNAVEQHRLVAEGKLLLCVKDDTLEPILLDPTTKQWEVASDEFNEIQEQLYFHNLRYEQRKIAEKHGNSYSWTGIECDCWLEFGCAKCNPSRWVSDWNENQEMAECGHCGKHLKGIRDHIKVKHNDIFYTQGPDNKYYSYQWLKKTMTGFTTNPRWERIYEQQKNNSTL